MFYAAIIRRILKVEEELASLAGPIDRSTAEGRRRHNRRSALYQSRKRLAKHLQLQEVLAHVPQGQSAALH